MTLQEIHKANHESFKEILYRDNKPHTKACDVYDKITEEKEDCEDSLGENFNSLIVTIVENFFEEYLPTENTKLEFYFSTYNFWLYTLVERIDYVFKILTTNEGTKESHKGKNTIFVDFYNKNFKMIREVRLWMNFIKHPKEFLFCHWPNYTLKESNIPNTPEVIKINLAFIEDNYTDPTKRVEILENQSQVWVHVPDLKKVTIDFCNELNVFFDFLCENKIVSDQLKEKTSLDKISKE